MDHEQRRMTGLDQATADRDSPEQGAATLVLIVDDEPPIATIIAAVVAELGYRVSIAAQGRAALELAQATWPALVITDLMMPELNGAALIGALRVEETRHGHAHVPVILMTAAGIRAAQRVGADAVLSKPFDVDELTRLITVLLLGSRPGTQHDAPPPEAVGGGVT